MKKIIGLLIFNSGILWAADYSIDPSHTRVGFIVRHIVSKVHGEFKEFDGGFSFDSKKPENSKGKFSVKASSIYTNNEKRDTHLKSADFFDVEKFKTLEFQTKKVSRKNENEYKMEGDLSLHGVTKPVVFNLEFMGSDKDPWGNQRAGFSATTKINRKDFGLIWNKILDSGGLLVGEEVEIVLNVEALQKK